VSFRLDEKIAVITGGSHGLGKAICEAFAGHGATVVVASRKQDACVTLACELTARTGQPSLGVACHVGRWDDCDRLIDTVNEAFGRVDILVNNAGMSPTYETLGRVTEDLFDKVLAVNFKGAFRLSVLAGEQMAASGADPSSTCPAPEASSHALTKCPTPLPRPRSTA
jgi:NAD(P)-dependent dehydrogenase (short-subunit alcohol dehydrogenase family)